MKTKTNSFTKVINFCVLTLFLITNMIFFTSCDNGNSPNDNTNEEQNNNSQTDYCEICDGLQTENCGIKHKCDDENCVEYSDNNIYKNGHTHDYCNEDGCILDDSVRHTTHDYCEKTDCDGSTHKGQTHPTAWFKETPIGGENISVRCVDINAVPGTNAKERFENIFNQYRTHIEGFTLNEQLTNVNFDLANATEFDQLIGTINPNKENMCPYNGINDVCKPAIEEIAKNVAITNEEIDLDYFYLNFRAFENEAYGLANDKNSKTYTEKKAEIEKDLENNNEYYNIDYSIYQEDGTIHQEALQRFDEMINAAATKLRNQGKQVTVDDLYNIINLSLTSSAIQGTHDSTISWTYTNENGQLKNAHHNSFDAGTANCTTNEMVDVIYGVEYEEMTPIAKPN